MRGVLECFARDFLNRVLKVLIGIWLLEKQEKAFSSEGTVSAEQGHGKVWNIQGPMGRSAQSRQKMCAWRGGRQACKERGQEAPVCWETSSQKEKKKKK